MNLAHFRISIHELLNKYLDKVTGGYFLIILDSKSAVCMAKNGDDTNYTRHVTIGINFVRNSEECKMHKIDWCEGDLQLEDIVTNNVGKNDLNTIIKYVMVSIDN